MTVKRKFSVTFDAHAHQFATAAAAKKGLTLSAWLNQIALEQAITQGVGREPADLEQQFMDDEAEYAAADYPEKGAA